MRHSCKVIGLFLGSAGIVIAIGLPWLLNKDRASVENVTNKVATTEDVQEFDLMWTNLESLQRKSGDLGPAEYKQQFLASTTTYLQLDAEQTEKFVNVADKALEKLGAARYHLTITRQETAEQQGDAGISQDSWSGEPPASITARRDAWSGWRDDQQKASDLLLGALQQNPRHHLLAERRLLWLLKLDFSLRDAAE